MTKIKIQDNEYTTLHLACYYTNFDVIKVLLENIQETGIDVNQRDSSWKTILYNLISCYCMYKSFKDVCKDGNTKSDQGFKYLVKNGEVYGIDLYW